MNNDEVRRRMPLYWEAFYRAICEGSGATLLVERFDNGTIIYSGVLTKDEKRYELSMQLTQKQQLEPHRYVSRQTPCNTPRVRASRCRQSR